MRDTLCIGQIINTHGIKGELKVFPLTDDIKRFRKLKKVLIDDVEREVIWCKLQNNRVILKIKDIDSIEQGMAYKNKYIRVKREDAVELPEGRYFVVDILGCSVIDTNGFEYGKVYEVLFTKNNDVYWVKGNKEILIPVLEDIVLDINVENKIIKIKPSEEWQYES